MAEVLVVNPYDSKGMGALQGVGGKQVPLGLCYICAVLEKDGHKVSLMDELVGQDSISYLRSSPCSVLFMGVFSTCAERAKKIINEAKSRNKDLLVVIGGAVAQPATANEYMDKLGADVMVMGEGEIAASEILSKPKSKWHLIKGIIFKDDNGKLVMTPDPVMIDDLDSLPFPAVHLLDLNLYKGPTEQGFFESCGEVTTSIMASRGCPFSCRFCGSGNKLGRKVRYRTPSNVVSEIEYYVKKFNIRHFTINDDTFTVNMPRVIEICKIIIEKQLDVRWIIQTRAEVSSPELFSWLKKAGCVMVAFGVESGSPKVLKIANKQLEIDSVRRSVKWAHEAGLRVKAYFMVNLPGEEEEDFKMSVDLAREIDPDYLWLSYFTPLPGTYFYEHLKSEGKITDKEAGDLSFFSDNRDSEIVKRHKEFLRSFYLRPGYFLRFLKRFSFKELIYMIRMGIVFVKLQFPISK